jgi:hypothetical protein
MVEFPMGCRHKVDEGWIRKVLLSSREADIYMDCPLPIGFPEDEVLLFVESKKIAENCFAWLTQ